MDTIQIRPIGFIRSPIKTLRSAPRFYTEGAPNATLELSPAYERGLRRAKVGNEIIVLTWLHRSHRNALLTYPEDDRSRPLTGVFMTRSPNRPNPIGLHRARILAIEPHRLTIGPIEVIDGTPVLDVKPVVEEADDS